MFLYVRSKDIVASQDSILRGSLIYMLYESKNKKNKNKKKKHEL